MRVSDGDKKVATLLCKNVNNLFTFKKEKEKKRKAGIVKNCILQEVVK